MCYKYTSLFYVDLCCKYILLFSVKLCCKYILIFCVKLCCKYTLYFETDILQDERLCDSTECGVQMHYVTLDDEIKVYGGWVKVHPSSHTHGSCGRDLACELQLVPDSGSLKKQEFHLIFLQFQLDDSNDEFMLKLDQASSTSFKDVSQIVSWTILI